MKTVTQIPHLQNDYLDNQQDDVIVSFQTHSQSVDKRFQSKKDKTILFDQVLKFINRLIEDQEFYSSFKPYFNKDTSANKVKGFLEAGIEETERKPFQNLSFKKVQITSSNCFQSVKKIQKMKKAAQNVRRDSKKVSIIIFQNQDNQQLFSGSDSLISDSSLKTLRQITLPSLSLSPQLIRQIFQSPSPFLMTLSLCLLLRYCIKRGHRPEAQDVSWILAMATIQAFKIYYDQQLEGMFQWYQIVMNVNKNDLKDLERCFLQKIDYMVGVRNFQYVQVLSQFAKMEAQIKTSQ